MFHDIAAVSVQYHCPNIRFPVFRIAVTPAGKYLGNGADVVAMFFSANPGETEKPLQKVASGGELSQLMEAVKSTLSNRKVM